MKTIEAANQILRKNKNVNSKVIQNRSYFNFSSVISTQIVYHNYRQ